MKARTRPKQFKLYKSDNIFILKKAYIEYYGSKGCNSVNFYYNNTLIPEGDKTLASLGIQHMDSLYAMENGRCF